MTLTPLRLLSSLFVVAGSSALAACGSPSGERADSTESDILGGFPATAAVFDAVGDIVEVTDIAADGTEVFDTKCSGTLIGPHTVLTASHCVHKYGTRDSFQYTKMYFRIGADSAHPREQVRVAGRALSPELTGGPVNLGTDVAVFQLASDITDVTPMPIGPAPTQDEIGEQFVAIGYGIQSTTGVQGGLVTRRFGSIPLVALTGNVLHAVWPTAADFVAAAQKVNPALTSAQLTPFYDSSQPVLVDGEEAFFSSVHTNGSTTCSGDSGAPILRRKGSSFEVAAVVSADPVRIGSLCFGGTIAGLPNTDANAAFVAAQFADATRDVPKAGYCNATSAIRSSGPDEGSKPIELVDCDTLGMVCVIDDGLATCAPPVTSGPASACDPSGHTFNVTGTSSYKMTLNADGTLLRNGASFAHWSMADGIFTIDDNHDACTGTPGTYVATFADDCNSFAISLAADPCELRAEAFDGAAFALPAP